MAAVLSRRHAWIPLALAAIVCTGCAKKGTRVGKAAAASSEPEIPAAVPDEPDPCPPELAPFDDLLTRFVAEREVPGASLAVLRDERLVCAKGYGVADRESGAPVEPGSLFRIASISKPITATAVMMLVEQGRLRLEDRVFDLLDLRRFVSVKAPLDPRLTRVTVLDLLRHSGGFDRDASFDPMFSSRKIKKALGLDRLPEPWDIIRYMVRRPLDFDPGTRYTYSNFGYLLLGRVVEQVAGATYEGWVREHVLGPIGATGARLGRTAASDALPGEVGYYDGRGLEARSVLDGQTKVPRPYGLWYLESMDAHGGWVMSAVDLARFSAAFARPDDSPLLSRESIERMFAPPPYVELDEQGVAREPFYGLGWRVRHKGPGRANVWHTGKLEGTGSAMVRRYDGTAWVVLFNTELDPGGTPLTDLIDPELHRAAAAVESWPENDLFERFP